MALNKNKTSLSNSKSILFVAGIICIVFGIILLINTVLDLPQYTFFLRSGIAVVLGFFFLYYSMAKKKTIWSLFLGISLTLVGFFILLLDLNFIDYSITELWPVIVIICGFSYLAAGLSIKKKLTVSVAVLSFVLTVMGIFFLLFSINIIDIPFVVFAARWWPILLILLGLGLVILFLYMQIAGNNAKTLLYDDNEEEE